MPHALSLEHPQQHLQRTFLTQHRRIPTNPTRNLQCRDLQCRESESESESEGEVR